VSKGIWPDCKNAKNLPQRYTESVQYFLELTKMRVCDDSIRRLAWPFLIVCLAILASQCSADDRGAAEAKADARLSRTVLYLASDELEGRGLGSPGLDLAADYIAEQFHEAGLKTDLYDGTPFQKFTVNPSSPHGFKLNTAPQESGKQESAGGSADAAATTKETAAKRIDAKNVIGVLEGEGPLADETIVVGAHYDHLGRGEPGTLEPGSHEIHHGADDNASGVAALIEIARKLSAREKKLPRRVVFIAFTGEERGLFGSARYAKEPLFPLDKTIAMVNLDMVGRLVDDKLVVYGTDTAEQWNGMLDRLFESHPFKVTRHPEGFGPSDHSSFYAKQIPVLFFFTGTHKDYHRPGDTFDKINVEGMRRVADLAADTVAAIAEMPDRPKYKATGSPPEFTKTGSRPYFGSIPDFSQEQPGYALSGVSKGGPAEKAGLKAEDVIIRLGEHPIGNLEDFDNALRKFKAGDRVLVVVKRAGEELKYEVTLEPPR
jgi:hypothetical protein